MSMISEQIKSLRELASISDYLNIPKKYRVALNDAADTIEELTTGSVKRTEREVTRILTAEITLIGRNIRNKEITPKDFAAKETERMIRECLNCDDVKVVNVQDFIRDVE
jgi:hypothetical protein